MPEPHSPKPRSGRKPLPPWERRQQVNIYLSASLVGRLDVAVGEFGSRSAYVERLLEAVLPPVQPAQEKNDAR